MLKGFNRALDHLEEWLIATLIAAATLLIFFAVVHRYGTGLSINLAKWTEAHGVPVLPTILHAIYSALAGLDVSWAQELCIFMFIWMAKFGAAYGVRTGIHVGVDVLVNLLPPRSRKRRDPLRDRMRRLFHGDDRGLRRHLRRRRCSRPASSPTTSNGRCGRSIPPSLSVRG